MRDNACPQHSDVSALSVALPSHPVWYGDALSAPLMIHMLTYKRLVESMW